MFMYTYEGPVLEFGKVIDPKWSGVTWAVSEKKARCNLSYRFKVEHGKIAGARITLPAEIKEVKNA